VDYFLDRLYHYNGTDPKHFQRFILLTNYQCYVDAFVSYAHNQLENHSDYTAFVRPGDVEICKGQEYHKTCDISQG